MVIKTVRFFPTNVYNDMFRDVVGHEWYAGTVECAYQNGMIDSGLVEDGKFFPLRAVTLEEFLIFAVNGYRSRRALPDFGKYSPEESGIYDGKCRAFAKPYVRAACALGLLSADGSEQLDRVPTRGEAAALCRKLEKAILDNIRPDGIRGGCGGRYGTNLKKAAIHNRRKQYGKTKRRLYASRRVRV